MSGGVGSCVDSSFLTHPDRAADEAVSVVDLEYSFEQLVTSHLICRHLTLQKVHGLRDAARKIYQGIGCVSPIQSLVAAINPARTRGGFRCASLQL